MHLLFQRWTDAWHRMDRIAARRGWQHEAPTIRPPAAPDRLAAFEARHQVTIPAQLRTVLAECSAGVRFGWSVPPELQPMERERRPIQGGLRGLVFDLDHIDQYALANFAHWRLQHARHPRQSEVPDDPSMWVGQFAFAELVNGDMLTIDCSSANGAQPVRYFSHELEGLHGRIIAPDFVSFITEYSTLGCAGVAHDDWFDFCDMTDPTHALLRADSPGGKAWLDWLSDLRPAADAPPRVVMAKSRADHDLLAAAQAGNRAQVLRALDDGAAIDACAEGYWSAEFVTPLIHAVRNDDRAMMELLVSRGAAINTRRMVLGEAAELSSLETVRWLIAHGARVNGWKGERHWPLHRLVEKRKQDAQGGEEAYFGILEALLDAGADPDAPWDNGLTMLMLCGPGTARVLLAHGADPDRRDVHGEAALHRQWSGEVVRLLVAHGADVNALSTPPPGEEMRSCRPVHVALFAVASMPDRVAALIDCGADPLLLDGRGCNGFFYCQTRADIEMLIMLGFPFDVQARATDGSTLLHNFIRMSGPSLQERGVHMVTFLVERGVDINAVDRAGRTVLHVVAEMSEASTAATLIALGADKTIADAAGHRPVDLLGASTKPRERALRSILT